MANFEAVELHINEYSDKWGPFIFHMPACTSATSNDGLLPYGTTLSACTVEAYVGVFSSGALLSSYEAVTTLIETDPAVVVNAEDVQVCMQYPGDTYTGDKITLVFKCTLSNGAKQAFFFNSVLIWAICF